MFRSDCNNNTTGYWTESNEKSKYVSLLFSSLETMNPNSIQMTWILLFLLEFVVVIVPFPFYWMRAFFNLKNFSFSTCVLCGECAFFHRMINVRLNYAHISIHQFAEIIRFWMMDVPYFSKFCSICKTIYIHEKKICRWIGME